MQQRGQAVALARGVDDEDHRRAEQRGDVGGRSGCGPGHGAVDAAVEQAHHALDHGDVGSPALPCRNSGPISSSPTSTGSRLRPGRPAASAW